MKRHTLWRIYDMSTVYKKQIGGDHYQSMEIQPSEFINKNNLPFAEGNAIKYLCRHKQKGQKQDRKSNSLLSNGNRKRLS